MLIIASSDITKDILLFQHKFLKSLFMTHKTGNPQINVTRKII